MCLFKRIKSYLGSRRDSRTAPALLYTSPTESTTPSVSEKDSSSSTETPVYGLGRGYTSASRLNYQNYLWQSLLSFNLHPSIASGLRHKSSSSNSNARVLELACGTALWASQIAQDFPNAQVVASDISLEQCPPTAWLPANLSLQQWNVFEDVPPEWVAAFDVIHIRLIQLVMDGGHNVGRLLSKMKRMLKPGGWVQWDESFTSQSYLLRQNETQPCPMSMARLKQFLTQRPTAWIGELDRTMEDVGFSRVELLRFDDKPWIARAFFGMYLMMEEEFVLGTKADTDEGLAMLENVKRMWHDSKNGTVVCAPKMVAIGRLDEFDGLSHCGVEIEANRAS